MSRPTTATISLAFDPPEVTAVHVDGYTLSPYERFLLAEIPSAAPAAAAPDARAYETPREIGQHNHGQTRAVTLRNLRTLGLVRGPRGGWRLTPAGAALDDATFALGDD